MTINNINNSGASGSATTTDASPATVCTFAISDDSAAVGRARVVARESSSGEVAGWELGFTAKRNGAGAVIIGSVDVRQHKTDACHKLWSASIVASGNNVLVQVKGEDSVTIDWSADISTREMYIT